MAPGAGATPPNDDPNPPADDTGQADDDQTPELPEGARKALDAARRDARRAEREKSAMAARLREFEDRDKTDLQRLQEQATQAEARAKQAELRAARLDVAARKGLPAGMAGRLQGETPEELEADADVLLEELGDRRPSPRPPARKDKDQGKGNGHVSSDDTDLNKWFRQAAGFSGGQGTP